MLQFKDGRFHRDGIAFILPDGFFFESECECSDDNALNAWSPDKTIHFTWQFYTDRYGVESWSELTDEDTGLSPLSKVQQIEINRLSGESLCYGGKYDQIYEARFINPAGGVLDFIAESKTENIVEICESSYFKEALSGITLDPRIVK